MVSRVGRAPAVAIPIGRRPLTLVALIDVVLVLAVRINGAAGRKRAGQLILLSQKEGRCRRTESICGISLTLFTGLRRDRCDNTAEADKAGQGGSGVS